MKRAELIRAGAAAECHASPPCKNCRLLAEVIIDAVIPLIVDDIAVMFDEEAARFGGRSTEVGTLTPEGAGFAHDQYRSEGVALKIRGWEPK
jgi:hypothetical protein